MTVHVISVGRSIIDSLTPPYEMFRQQPDLREDIRLARPLDLLAGLRPGRLASREASRWLAAALRPPGGDGRDDEKAAALASACAAARPGEWPAVTSAELATFDRPPGVKRPLPKADLALLICSDTADGQLAGVWNAVALTGNKLDRVTYLDSPRLEPGAVRGQAVIVRVPGMDAADAEGFAEAMSGLGALGRHLLDSGDVPAKEPFRFYLSGGFKAAIPYLIGIAEGLRSLDPERPVQAYVLHESAPAEAPLVGLPLRYLTAERVIHELSGFGDDGVRPEPPKLSLLNGYAYEIRRGKCHLTAFGAGLRALFAIDTPRLGG